MKTKRPVFDSEANYYDPGHGDWLVIDGQIIERDALAIAEKLNEYDENLVIMCLANDSTADLHDAPFVVCERQADGRLVRVLEAWQLDDRILERIWAADTKRFDILAKLEKMEKDQKDKSERRYREKMDENLDILVSVAKTPKSTYTVHNHQGELIRTHEDHLPTRVSSEKTITHGPARSPE